MFTHDMDFSALLAVTGAAGPSVLQVRAQDILPDAIGRDVVRVLNMRSPAFAEGAIVTIDKVKSHAPRPAKEIRRTTEEGEGV